MVDGVGQMFITGPDVIRSVTGEESTHESLGGATVHMTQSGVAHLVASNEDDLNAQVRYLLSFLPSNNLEDPPWFAPEDDPLREAPELDTIAPEQSEKPYDMHEVLRAVLDDGEFFELQSGFAPNIICGLGRLDGYPVGVVANQPRHLAGTIDIDASEKAARFVRMCDAFNIPLVVFEDVPGFLPGINQEHEGIIRRGSKLLYAFAEATVPRITVITRKAYGGAYVVMNSKHIGADFAVAWPTAEIAVMGAKGAVEVLFRGKSKEEVEKQEENYKALFSNPFPAARKGKRKKERERERERERRDREK
jgi:acetyl-CoA carboxylase carboxyltransferase component